MGMNKLTQCFSNTWWTDDETEGWQFVVEVLSISFLSLHILLPMNLPPLMIWQSDLTRTVSLPSFTFLSGTYMFLFICSRSLQVRMCPTPQATRIPTAIRERTIHRALATPIRTLTLRQVRISPTLAWLPSLQLVRPILILLITKLISKILVNRYMVLTQVWIFACFSRIVFLLTGHNCLLSVLLWSKSVGNYRLHLHFFYI